MVTWSEHSRHSAWCVCLHCTHKSPHPGEDGRPGHRLTVFSVTDPQTRVNLKRRGRWNTDTHRETVSDLIDSYEKNPPQPVAIIAATLRAMTSCLRTCSHVACLVGEEIDFFFFFFLVALLLYVLHIRINVRLDPVYIFSVGDAWVYMQMRVLSRPWKLSQKRKCEFKSLKWKSRVARTGF